MSDQCEITPVNAITFNCKTNTGTISIINNTLSGKAFKIKTTKPNEYTVKPNIGTIHPFNTAHIEIIMQKKLKIFSDHKFLVEVYNFDWRFGLDQFKQSLMSKDKKLEPEIKRMLGVDLIDENKEVVFKSKRVFEWVCMALIGLQVVVLVGKMLMN